MFGSLRSKDIFSHQSLQPLHGRNGLDPSFESKHPDTIDNIDTAAVLNGEQPRVLTLAAGPERIESGWWDGGDARRDYFVAIDSAGRRLWIFRDPRPPGGWFLHGVFA